MEPNSIYILLSHVIQTALSKCISTVLYKVTYCRSELARHSMNIYCAFMTDDNLKRFALALPLFNDYKRRGYNFAERYMSSLDQWLE